MADPQTVSNKETQFNEGSTVNLLYGARDMKCYPITESELHSLSLANGFMTTFISLAAACFTFAVDITKDVVMAKDLTPFGEILNSVISPLGYFFGFAFLFIAWWSYRWRQGMLQTIKNETIEKDK